MHLALHQKIQGDPIDASVIHKVRQIASRRPTYGTRRMAVQISRETGMSTNRKKIQQIYRKIGWSEPQKTKNDIIRTSRRKRFKPTGPNQLWETDITYIHCGRDGWCYCFNVLDVFTRKWAAYMFDTAATADTAIQTVLPGRLRGRWEGSGIEAQDRQRFTVHQPQISGGNESIGDPARVHLEAHARTERTRSLSTERSNGSMYGHMSLSGSKTPKWCWPERLQTTTTTRYTRLGGMSPPMSLLAKWRVGINEG